MLLINCEIELALRWARSCVISEISRTFRVASDQNADQPAYEVAKRTTSPIFQINNAKLYVPFVTLSINDIKFFKNIRQGFERTISWNKYRFEITAQPKNNLD